MQVKELIKQLQELPQEDEIVITAMDDHFYETEFEVHSPYTDGQAQEIIIGTYFKQQCHEHSNDGVVINRDVLCEIDSELFFNEISMDTKSWSFDYDNLEQNTKVFEYVKKYYPQELQALKDGRTDYLTVYYD